MGIFADGRARAPTQENKDYDHGKLGNSGEKKRKSSNCSLVPSLFGKNFIVILLKITKKQR